MPIADLAWFVGVEIIGEQYPHKVILLAITKCQVIPEVIQSQPRAIFESTRPSSFMTSSKKGFRVN